MTLVRHSLNPWFSRGWASTADAIADGSLDIAMLRRLWGRLAPSPAAGERVLWALDGTTWRRPAAKTSPERTFCRFVTGGQPQEGMVAGWEWQWLGVVADPPSSWVLPLDVARRGPQTGTATELAITQLRAALASQGTGAPRPVVVMDSHYRLGELVAQDLDCDLLARLPARRTLYHRPRPKTGRLGAPRKHGPVFRTHDPSTHGLPDHHVRIADPRREWIQLDVWEQLHEQPAPQREVTVIRVTVGRLPRRETAPEPLWLVWHGTTAPADPNQWLRWYEQRFAIEHLFRFLKQDLGWTTVRLRDPVAAERWSWLIAAGYWQLWLARADRAATTMPWERPLRAFGTPGQVRRGFAGLLCQAGTLAKPPRPRGKSPGRQPGRGPGPYERHPVQRRAPPEPQ